MTIIMWRFGLTNTPEAKKPQPHMPETVQAGMSMSSRVDDVIRRSDV